MQVRIDQLVGYAQTIRHEAKALLEATTASDKEQTANSVALGNAPLLFPKAAPIILAENGKFAAGPAPSRNAPLEAMALRLGEVYARLEAAKVAYAKADGEISVNALAIGAEANLCLGVMNALNGYLSAEGLINSAVAAALGGGQVPAGFQKSSGGILLPAKAS